MFSEWPKKHKTTDDTKQMTMETMSQYVEWSDHLYTSYEGIDDQCATVVRPFMGFSVGEKVNVTIQYANGCEVYVNNRPVQFMIAES